MFIKSMCEFIELVPMEIHSIHTNKEVFRKMFDIKEADLKGSKENKEKRGLVYYLSALKHMELFTKGLAKDNGIGYIHADSRTYQDRDLLDAFLHIKQHLVRGNTPNKNYKDAKKHLVSITFADKSALSSGVQLADFASFIIFAHLERKMNLFNEIGLSRAWNTLRNKIKISPLIESFGKANIDKYI